MLQYHHLDLAFPDTRLIMNYRLRSRLPADSLPAETDDDAGAAASTTTTTRELYHALEAAAAAGALLRRFFVKPTAIYFQLLTSELGHLQIWYKWFTLHL